MGNRTHIQFLKCEELDDNLEPLDVSYFNIHVYDDYGSSDHYMGSKEEMQKTLDQYGTDPLARALAIVRDTEIIEYAINEGKGIYVNGNYYDADRVERACGIGMENG